MSSVGSAIHIVIADSTAMVCELLKSAFKRRPKFLVKSCATNLKNLEYIARHDHIDVPLVGTNLEEGPFTGVQAIQRLRLLQPRCRPVLLLDGSEDALIVEAFRAGAKGVFQRSEQGFEALCNCIARVHAGEIWANNKQLEAVMKALERTTPVRLTNRRGESLLSKRENEIVRLVAEGASNREIATRLGLSQHTVKNYLFKIFEKLGVSSRVELLLYAMDQVNKAATFPMPEKLAS